MSFRNVIIGVSLLFVIIIIFLALRGEEGALPPVAGPEEVSSPGPPEIRPPEMGEALPKPDEVGVGEEVPSTSQALGGALPDPVDLSQADRDRGHLTRGLDLNAGVNTYV